MLLSGGFSIQGCPFKSPETGGNVCFWDLGLLAGGLSLSAMGLRDLQQWPECRHSSSSLSVRVRPGCQGLRGRSWA